MNDTFNHTRIERDGLLLVNLGTPRAATPKDVRSYLAEFLGDRRVVDLFRPLWWLILHGVILRIRPRRVARAYAEIWEDDGSPLLVRSQRLTEAVAAQLPDLNVRLAMTYGEPSIADALDAMAHDQVRRLVVLPLYPQYSATTTAAVFDALARGLADQRHVPELHFVRHYTDDPGYINALAESIKAHWAQQGRADRLVFSFHGIPERYHRLGDPYPCQCRKTVRLVVEQLGLDDGQWELAFQSRFGREPWLSPYLDQRLMALPEEGVRSVDVICPGFAADCLETLEEVAMANCELFVEHGGERFSYIPALNDAPAHAKALADLARRHLPPAQPDDATLAAARQQRAQAAGATQ